VNAAADNRRGVDIRVFAPGSVPAIVAARRGDRCL